MFLEEVKIGCIMLTAFDCKYFLHCRTLIHQNLDPVWALVWNSIKYYFESHYIGFTVG